MNRVLKFAAIAATGLGGLLATASAADAAVSYEGTHEGVVTGHIDKGDIQPVLVWNETKVQNTPVNFSTTFTTTTDTSWLLADGSTAHNVKTLTFKQGLTKDIVSKSNGKIDGWNLTGLGSLEYVKTEVTGPALYSGYAGGLHVDQDHALGDQLFVNNVLLPETPVTIPTV